MRRITHYSYLEIDVLCGLRSDVFDAMSSFSTHVYVNHVDNVIKNQTNIQIKRRSRYNFQSELFHTAVTLKLW